MDEASDAEDQVITERICNLKHAKVDEIQTDVADIKKEIQTLRSNDLASLERGFHDFQVQMATDVGNIMSSLRSVETWGDDHKTQHIAQRKSITTLISLGALAIATVTLIILIITTVG